MMKLRSEPLKKVQVCKNRAENVEATSNNTTYNFFGKKFQIQLFFSCFIMIETNHNLTKSVKTSTSYNHLSKQRSVKKSIFF